MRIISPLLILTLLMPSHVSAAENESGIRFLLQEQENQETDISSNPEEANVDASAKNSTPPGPAISASSVPSEEAPKQPPQPVAAESIAVNEIDRRKKLEIGFLGGVMANNYNLTTSSGYSIKLPPAVGPFLGLHFLYSPNGASQYFFEAWEERRKFKTITGVTPGPLEVKDRVVTLGFRTPTAKRFYLEPFYRWQMKLVDEIRPIAVMTASQLHGIGLRIGMEREKENFWRNSVHVGVFSPVFYKERFQRTGNSRLRFSFDLQNRFRYFLKNNFYLGVGLQFQVDAYSYSGRGDRSISDSRERWLKLAIPLEVGRRF